MAAYNRYEKFTENGTIGKIPFIEIEKNDTDYYETYRLNVSRLDKISNDYYGSPDYGWLIMMANPEYGALEYDIPDGSLIRIPYPLGIVISKYNKAIDNYRKMY